MCDAPNANSPTENLELDEAELDPIPEQLQDMVRQIAAFVRRPETEIERILRERDGAFGWHRNCRCGSRPTVPLS
jgi:hypothetical protein